MKEFHVAGFLHSEITLHGRETTRNQNIGRLGNRSISAAEPSFHLMKEAKYTWGSMCFKDSADIKRSEGVI